MSGPCGMEPRRGTRDSCAFPPEPAVRTHRGLLLRGTDDSALGDRLLPERDAGDGSGLVVRNEQGTVGPDEHVDGTPPCFLALEPALGEGLLGNRLPVPEAHERHPVPDLLLPVPRAVLGDEDLAAVLGGEHRTRVEPHPERRDVGAQLEGRRAEALAGKLLAELRVGDVSSVAVREPEVEAGVRREVQLVGGAVVSEPVAPVVREPQLLRLGMPVETDRVPHAAGDDFEARTVGPEARDRGVRVAAPADVAWRADRDVEEPVRPERDELPAVVRILRERVRHDDRRRRALQPFFDAVEAEEAGDFHDVERAVPHGDAVRLVQVLREREDLPGARPVARVHDGIDGPGVARPDEERPAGAHRHRARARNRVAVDRDPETRRELDRGEADLGPGAPRGRERENEKEERDREKTPTRSRSHRGQYALPHREAGHRMLTDDTPPARLPRPLDPLEIRALGALLEKQQATTEYYPH